VGLEVAIFQQTAGNFRHRKYGRSAKFQFCYEILPKLADFWSNILYIWYIGLTFREENKFSYRPKFRRRYVAPRSPSPALLPRHYWRKAFVS